VTQSRPAADRLDLLDDAEADSLPDLTDGAFGPSVRLEQERISFAAIERWPATLFDRVYWRT
jgi:hypothetical protein